ncbi:FAD-binding oxidoreductase [Pseudarthrobacter sp. NPDC092439]|uniref:FAD-binding oxidoreductase n=1 Tax=unclassified Pseudarthrobacter TaxID=2647000 RepID=UPI00382215BE
MDLTTPPPAEDHTAEVLNNLRQQLSGPLLEPHDPGYDEARRVWNGMQDLRPRAIARAGSIADIDPVLAAARSTGLVLAVRGGGHNIAGHGSVEGGLVLDLGGLRRVTVDAEALLVTAEPGATLADIDQATAAHGLAVPVGVISQTGIAGLTLGGGVGWLTRSNGLTLDNLASADVVTATGEHLRAGPEENGELFWGLRGGGGNFGVVASFTFRARRLPGPVLGANLFYRPEHWKEGLQRFAAWATDLPEDMNPILSFLVFPPEFGMGAAPWMIIGCAWANADHQPGLELIGRLRDAAPPDQDEVGPVSWPEWQSAMDGLFPKGSRGYWKNASFSRLDDEVIDVVIGFASKVAWQGTGIDIHLLGGAFARVPEQATAYPSRASRYLLNIYGFWPSSEDDARLTEFARAAHGRMQPFAEQGEYLNFLGSEERPDVQAARLTYGPDKYGRLLSLKQRYDPDNLFSRNHNIVPSRLPDA